MAVRQLDYQEVILRLSDEFGDGYIATTRQKEITESGRLLLSMLGDKMEANLRARNDQSRPSQEGFQELPTQSRLSYILRTVDTVLVWLERSTKNLVTNLKKQETVLRGIFHLVDLGNYAMIFPVLELASSFLDIADDQFQGQREFIQESLKDIGEQKDRILQLVEEAGEILNEIITTEKINIVKVRQFDNIVGQAHVEIGLCRRRLHKVKEKFDEISTKMNSIKWFSRACRCIGWVLSCYFFFRKFKESTYRLPLVLASSSISAVILASYYPQEAYKFDKSVSVLASRHSLLTERLEDLREKLCRTKDFRDGLVKHAGDTV